MTNKLRSNSPKPRTFLLAAPNWAALGAAAQFGRARRVVGARWSHRSAAYDKHETGKTTDDVAGAQLLAIFLLVFGVIIWGFFPYFSWHLYSFSFLFSLCCQTTLLHNFARSGSSCFCPAASAWQSRKVNFLIRVASETKQLVSLSEQSFFVLPLLHLHFCFAVFASSFAPALCASFGLCVFFFIFLISLPCFGQNYARACELLKK